MASQPDCFISSIIKKASLQKVRIALPEATDPRIIKAAKILSSRAIADITLIGNTEDISSIAQEHDLDLSLVTIIDPLSSPKLSPYASLLYELRKHKGLTEEDALKLAKDPVYFGTLMLKQGDVDGLVSGAAHSTADTVRPALQIIKTQEDIKRVSSIFFMTKDNVTYVFGDCAIQEYPTSDELAEIAVLAAEMATLFDINPLVAMLSSSTKGSGTNESVKTVVEATTKAQQMILTKYGNDTIICIDGELQGDAALVESVSILKAPHSPVAGKARVLIFPNIDAGNICYKLTERIGGADAFGPILQGLAKPMNDLSRGCSVDDIVGIVAITAVQAQASTTVRP